MAPAPRREVLVVGGGIGGLAAALALARRGAWVRVLEQAPRIDEVGAGLQITPNGARVLRALGLPPETLGLRALAVEPRDALSGHRLARFDLGRAGGDYVFAHRADLIGRLLQAAEAAGVAVRTDARVASVTPQGVALDGGETLSADLVVGADGIRSTIRRHLLGEESATFTGQVAWRALVPFDQEPVARIWMAPGRHAVTYPVREGLVNLVAVQEQAAWAEEGWSHRDTPESLQAAFGDVALELKSILARVTEVGRWGLFLHPVPQHWHDGRAVLLGDAAHPTLPFLAQGANLALEDAWVLAREVMQEDLAEGLDRYQFDRRPRVVDAIDSANANARNYHLAGGRRRAAHAGLRLIGRLAPQAFLRRYDWLYGYDVTAEG